MKAQSHIKITEEEKKQLIKAQQGELDAVVLYRKLSVMTKEIKNKEIFLKIAADEGKHASILRKYTGEKLEAKNFKTLVVTITYKVFGEKYLLNTIGKGEFKAAKDYLPLVMKFPDIQKIIDDENLHGNLMSKMIKS
ncbi:hypothetical protein K9O30_02775 [Clostridium bowmanii]|uniref:ferritin family protein n=1 Tax=Clostridium bowmanii TaxID=132925 RepID=UPI001C0AF270|nr:ferritin family protein [Clostridium bowmanii]MBU3188292.1 hypothetical protein [Clostridium bowmanii]MCA1072680.1 hypothetical protein [Clostridium bowmanii]